MAGAFLWSVAHTEPGCKRSSELESGRRRIDQLIRDSEYLKPADYSRMPAYERERMAMRVMGFYHHLPNDVERPYPQDLYHEEGRKALVEKLEAPEQAVELLEQMDNALLSVPLDSGEYERKAESLSILHQYVEGTYTIFPEKKRAVEIAVPEQGQMSMFDFMEQEPQSKEQSTAAAVEEPQKAKVVARYQSTVMMQEGYIEILQFYNILMASSITIITMTKKRARVLQKQGRLTVWMMQSLSFVKREKMQKQ